MSVLIAGLAGVLTAMIVIGLGSPLTDPSRRPVVGRVTITARGLRRWRDERSAAVRIFGRLAERRRWRRGISADAVAAWCDTLARRVRSGFTLREATRVEVPTDVLLAEVTAPLRLGIERGRPLSVVAGELPVDRLSRRSTPPGTQHLVLACSVITSAADLGGSAAAPLDRVGAALRLRSADAQERVAHSAQARLSAHVLTVVPLGILVLLVATDPDVRTSLATSAGTISLVVGLLLNIGGWSWMRFIIEARS